MDDLYAQLKIYALWVTGALLIIAGLFTLGSQWYGNQPEKVVSDQNLVLISYIADIVVTFLIGFMWGAVYWEKKRENVISKAVSDA